MLEVNIEDWARLRGKPGWVEIVDLMRARIEQIEDVEPKMERVAETVADARVEERGRARAHRAILDERARSEIAEAQRAVPRAEIVDRDLGAGDDFAASPPAPTGGLDATDTSKQLPPVAAAPLFISG